MLILPVDGSLLYIEPIYLQSSSSKMPQIKKIVAATKDKLVWGDSLDQALSGLLGTTIDIGGIGPVPSTPGTGTVPGTGTTPDTTAPGTVTAEQKALIAEAVATMTRYRQYTAAGDFAKAGQELKALEDVLAKLDALQKTP